MDLPWEMHRATIRSLYLEKDMTRKEVMDEMERAHQFKATAGQYERQFKKWDFRKNLTAEEWQFVSRRVEKRKRDGKDTDVKIDGVRVPGKKLAKAIARYGQGSTLKRVERQWNKENAFRSPTPEGIGFVTPAVSPLPSLKFSSLPWLEFREMTSLQLKAQPGAFRDHGSMNTRGSSVMDCRFTKAVVSSVPSLESTPETQGDSVFDHLMLAEFMASNNISTAWKSFITSMGLSPSQQHLELASLPWNFINRLQTPANLQILKHSSSSKHQPRIEALFEVLFMKALESGNVALVEMLLSCSKIDVNEFLPGGFPELPLQVAVRCMDAPMTRLLLDRGAKATSIVEADLHCLLSESSREPIEMPPTSQRPRIELSHIAYETTIPEVPMSPESMRLAEAAESGPAEAGPALLVKALLDDRADVNAPNVFGLTPLQLAANTSWESLEIVGLLLEAGADVDRRSCDNNFLSPTPLQIAIYKRKFHVAELLVRAGADVNAGPARLSAESIDLGQYTHLAFDLDGRTALNIALHFTSDKQCAGLLLRNHAIYDNSALARLYERDERDMIRQCFESGDTYPLDPHVLMAAAKAGHLGMVQRSLDAGVDVNHLSSCNETALTTSILSPDCSKGPGRSIPALLIESGADINRPGAHPSALEAAICKANVDLITTLIRKGAPCDQSALETAVRTNRVDFVLTLIQNGAPCQRLSLEEAVRTENMDIILVLIRNGARCDKSSLEKAVRLQNVDIILALIQNGAPCHELSLEEAVRTGSSDVISTFVRNGARCDGRSLYRIVDLSIRQHTASRFDPIFSEFPSEPDFRETPKAVPQNSHKAVDVLPNLLETSLDAVLAEPDFCAEFQTTCIGHAALFTAIWQGSHESVDVLFRKGISLSSSCLAIALKDMCHTRFNVSLIGTLITAGVPVNIPKAPENACYWDCVKWVRSCDIPGYWHIFLARGWSPPQEWSDDTLQPLHVVAREGHEEAVQLLLDNGADSNLYGQQTTSNCPEKKTKTVLSCAVESRRLTTVKILLEAVSDVNQPALGPFGRTALQTAVDLGDMDIVEELIQAGADVNADPAEYAGATALQAAAIKGYLGIATRLVDLGADINAPAAKAEGRTALEGAAEHGKIDTVQFLLNSGADIRSPEFGALQYGRAVNFARENGYNTLARLLERHWRGPD